MNRYKNQQTSNRINNTIAFAFRGGIGLTYKVLETITWVQSPSQPPTWTPPHRSITNRYCENGMKPRQIKLARDQHAYRSASPRRGGEVRGGGAHLGRGDLVEAVEHEADAGEEVCVGVFVGAVRGHGEGPGRSGDWGLGFVWVRPVIDLKMEGQAREEGPGLGKRDLEMGISARRLELEGTSTLSLPEIEICWIWISRRASSPAARGLLDWIGRGGDRWAARSERITGLCFGNRKKVTFYLLWTIYRIKTRHFTQKKKLFKLPSYPCLEWFGRLFYILS